MFTQEFKGTIYVTLSGILYGSMSYFGIRLLQSNFSISDMLFWRFFFSSFFLMIMLVPTIRHINTPVKTLFNTITVGSIFYGSSSCLYFMACQYICSSLAMVIFFVYPCIVAVLNRIFYRTRITGTYIASFILISLGIALLTDMTQIEFNICGILLAIASGLAYAFYLILSKKQVSALNPLVGSLTISVGSCIIFLLASLFEKGNVIIPDNVPLLMYCIGNGFIATALPMFLMLVGLRHVSSTKASILSVLEPVFTLIFGVLLLEEILGLTQIVGIIIVLVGSLIICCNDSQPKQY